MNDIAYQVADSTGHFSLDSLKYSDIKVVGECMSWDGFYEEAQALEAQGTYAYIIKKLDSCQYFGKDKNGCWIDVTNAWRSHLEDHPEDVQKDEHRHNLKWFSKLLPKKPLKIVNPNAEAIKDKLKNETADALFIKNRVCFEVAKYALADVIEALANDTENFVRIVVTKEDNQLVVMFDRRHKSCHSDAVESNVSPA